MSLTTLHTQHSRRRLRVAARRKLHVNATAKDTVITFFNFRMTQKKQAGGGGHQI